MAIRTFEPRVISEGNVVRIRAASEAVLPGVIVPDSHVEFVLHLEDTWRMRRVDQQEWRPQPSAFIFAQSHGALRFDAPRGLGFAHQTKRRPDEARWCGPDPAPGFRRGCYSPDSVSPYRVKVPALESSLMLRTELARTVGCSAETLRYYEAEGLLRPKRRGRGDYRHYEPPDVARVALIRNARNLGLSLKTIRDLLHLSDERRGLAHKSTGWQGSI